MGTIIEYTYEKILKKDLSPDMMYKLGCHYEREKTRDCEKAYEYFLHAAEAGCVRAYFRLVSYYLPEFASFFKQNMDKYQGEDWSTESFWGDEFFDRCQNPDDDPHCWRCGGAPNYEDAVYWLRKYCMVDEIDRSTIKGDLKWLWYKKTRKGFVYAETVLKKCEKKLSELEFERSIEKDRRAENDRKRQDAKRRRMLIREMVKGVLPQIRFELNNHHSLAYKLLKTHGYLYGSKIKDWEADIYNPKTDIHKAFKNAGYFEKSTSINQSGF